MKCHILIVEDEAIVALDMKSSLEDCGYKNIEIVSSGEECLAFCKENNPDIIVMDIILSGKINGIETAAEIKDVPVIFTSGSTGLLIDEDLYHSSPGRGVIVKKNYLATAFAESDWEGMILYRLHEITSPETVR